MTPTAVLPWSNIYAADLTSCASAVSAFTPLSSRPRKWLSPLGSGGRRSKCVYSLFRKSVKFSGLFKMPVATAKVALERRLRVSSCSTPSLAARNFVAGIEILQAGVGPLVLFVRRRREKGKARGVPNGALAFGTARQGRKG